MKKIIVHIGDAKTGSSSIQNYLTHNREILESRGILYSRIGLLADHGIANHKLAFCLNPKRVEYQSIASDLYSNLRAEIEQSHCSTLLISSEGFCSLRERNEVMKLKQALYGFDIRIVAYLRRPDLWIESWYAQIVKKSPFITLTFTEYLKNHQNPSLSSVLQYAEVFGRQNVLARPFESSKMYRNDLIEDFFYTIGHIKEGVAVEDSNKSPDIYTTELLRVLNGSINLKPIQRVHLNEAVIKAFRLSKIKNYLPKEMRRHFLSQYSNEISEFNKWVFGEETFFSVPDYDIDHNMLPSLDDLKINISEFISFIEGYAR